MMKILKGLAVFCLTFTVLVYVVKAGTSCKNDEDTDVDWFFMYKFPNGGQYVYVDNNTPSSDESWTLSDKNISENTSALANTIAPLTAKKTPTDLAYAVYNDGEEGSNQNKGHTKGLFIFDKKTGVWLMHSVPKYPVLKESMSEAYPDPMFEVYPDSGLAKSQIFLCVTFPSSELETIAEHLRLQHPNIYVKSSPFPWAEETHIHRLLNNEFINEEPWNLTANLSGVDGNNYMSFATHKKFNEDVYSALVAPTLQTDLLVSSWRNGRVVKVPNHRNGTLTVINVIALTFRLGVENTADVENPVVVENLVDEENPVDEDNPVDVENTEDVNNTVDHSKWAISQSPEDHNVCVGTLNRVFSQYKRGGETLCFTNKLLHGLLKNTITSVSDEWVVKTKTTKKTKQNNKKAKKITSTGVKRTIRPKRG